MVTSSGDPNRSIRNEQQISTLAAKMMLYLPGTFIGCAVNHPSANDFVNREVKSTPTTKYHTLPKSPPFPTNHVTHPITSHKRPVARRESILPAVGKYVNFFDHARAADKIAGSLQSQKRPQEQTG